MVSLIFSEPEPARFSPDRLPRLSRREKIDDANLTVVLITFMRQMYDRIIAFKLYNDANPVLLSMQQEIYSRLFSDFHITFCTIYYFERILIFFFIPLSYFYFVINK